MKETFWAPSLLKEMRSWHCYTKRSKYKSPLLKREKTIIRRR